MSNTDLFTLHEIQAAAGHHLPHARVSSAYDPGHLFNEQDIATISQPPPLPALFDTLKARRAGHENLTVDDIFDPQTESWPNPLIRAVRNRDITKLQSIIAWGKYDLSAENDGTTPLIAALDAQLPQNAVLLLQHGADPNGPSYQRMLKLRARFRRFQTQISKGTEELEIAPLTKDEFDHRLGFRTPFWHNTRYPPLPLKRFRMGRTALERCVSLLTESEEIIDLLIAAGADTSAWTRHYTSIPTNAPPISYLSPTSPLHEAIKAGHIPTIQHLLHHGHSPSIFPLSNPNACLNALMSSLLINPPNLETFRLLLAHAEKDARLLTPVIQISILHLATATLSLPILKLAASAFPIPEAQPTALGHTLLHIACLPASDAHTEHHAPSIYASIHDMRSLDVNTWPHLYLAAHKSTFPPRDYPPAPPIEGDLADTVQYLLAHGCGNQIKEADYAGNTPLHYLAAHRTFKEKAWDLLREVTGAEEVWSSARNRWNYTPKDLFEDANEVRGDRRGVMPFWKD